MADKLRFGGGLELPAEVEEMMAKITDLTGCAVVVIPSQMTDRSTLSHENIPQTVFVTTVHGGYRAEIFRVCGW